jgi:hypothetical protein
MVPVIMSQQDRDVMLFLTSLDKSETASAAEEINNIENWNLNIFLKSSQHDPWVTQQLRRMFHQARPELDLMRLSDSKLFAELASSYTDWQEFTNAVFRDKKTGTTATGSAVQHEVGTDSSEEPAVEDEIAAIPGTRWVISEQLLYHDQSTPYAYVDYVLELASGKILKGKTDADGWVRHEVTEGEPFKIRLLEDELDAVDDEPDLGDEEDEDTEDVPEEVLSGTIIEASGRIPLADVAVEIVGLDETVYTDNGGYFEVINVDMGEYEIRVDGLGVMVPTHDEPNPSYKIILPVKPV